MKSVSALLQYAIRLRTRRENERAINILSALRKEYPENPDVAYHYAWTLDHLGREEDAIPLYQAAIKNKLNHRDMVGCFLGLGSSLRCQKRFKESEKILSHAIRQHPSHPILQVFLALTYSENNRKTMALRALMDVMLKTSSNAEILSYRKFFARCFKKRETSDNYSPDRSESDYEKKSRDDRLASSPKAI